MIYLTIEHDDGKRSINLLAENMKDLIDNVLPSWLPDFEKDMKMIRQTRRYKAEPEKVEKEEVESGWYYRFM